MSGGFNWFDLGVVFLPIFGVLVIALAIKWS